MIGPLSPLEHLGEATCWDRLRQADLARIAVVSDGRPDIFPVNHAVTGDRRIVFRTATGMKLAAVEALGVVALEVDGVSGRSGWSVVARGRARRVRDPEEVEGYERLGLEPWAPGSRTIWVRLDPDSVTGRRIRTDGTPTGG